MMDDGAQNWSFPFLFIVEIGYHEPIFDEGRDDLFEGTLQFSIDFW
jgi:hypothetical protein